MGSRVQCNVCWPEAEAEQGVAPVIVTPALPKKLIGEDTSRREIL